MAQEETLALKIRLDTTASVKSIDDLIKRNKELAKALAAAPMEGAEGYEELNAEIAKARAEYAKNREAINKHNQAMRETEAASGSMTELSRTLRELEKEYKNLSKEQREAFGADLQAKIKATRDELKALEAELGDHRRNVGNYPNQMGQGFFSMGNAIKGVGVIAAAALTFDTLKGAAENVAAVTREFVALKGAIQTVATGSDEELDAFTVQVAAIAKTFGKSTDEIIVAANALSKQMNGGDFGKSLDQIETGLLSGADANGEFLDSLREYPALMAEAGLSSDQLIAVLNKSATEGIYSDKGVDAIKEAMLSMREQTTATQDAVVALFGEAEGRELLADVKTGEVPILDAIGKISDKMATLDPQSQAVGLAMADIFKGAGEDAGFKFISTLGTINGDLSKLIDTTNVLTQSQLKQLESEKQLAEAKLETSKRFQSLTDGSNVLANTLQTVLYETLNHLFDIFAPLGDTIGWLGDKARGLAERFGLVGEGGSMLDGVVQGLTMGIEVMVGVIDVALQVVGYLFDGFGYLYDNVGLVRWAVDKAIDTFTGFYRVVINLPAVFNGIVAGIQQVGQNIYDWFSQTLLSAQIFVKELDRTFRVRSSARDRISAEIAALEADKKRIADSGKSVGEAFNEAFDKTISDKAAAKVIDEKKKKDLEKQADNAGRKFMGDFSNAMDKEATKSGGVVKALEKVFAEGSLDGLRAELSKANELLDSLTPGTEGYAAAVDSVRAATEALAKAEAARSAMLMSDADRAKAAAESAAKELETRREGIDKEMQLERLAAQQRRDIALANDKLTAKEREAIMEQYAKDIAAIELKAEYDRLALLEVGSVEQLRLKAEIADKELAIRQGLYDADVEAAKASEQKKLDQKKYFEDMAVEAAQAISDALFTIEAQSAQREFDERTALLDKETEAKLAAAEGDEAEQTRIKAEAEAKRLAIEKDVAERRRGAAITQAIVNGALAAVQAMANTTLPFPLSLTALIPVALQTALQIATIKRQKFARGKGALPRGRRHSGGGIPAVLGSEVVEIEDNEAIVNRTSSQRYSQLLSDVNQDGGGIRYPGTQPLTATRRARLRMLEAMPGVAERGLFPSFPNNTRRFEQGGVAMVGNGQDVKYTLSDEDVERIAEAVYRGAKNGLQNADIAGRLKRQAERDAEFENRKAV